MLFVLHGAPDLALTQFLVETLTLVVFVLVLRRLPKDFTERHRPRERAGARRSSPSPSGCSMAGVGAVALGARTATPGLGRLPARRPTTFGGGKNIVNVTLVDIRAWDTMGEISVLVVAATGVASLVFLRRRTGAVDRLDRRPRRARGRRGPAAHRAGSWLRRERRRWPRSAARSSSRWSPGCCSTRSSCSRVYLLFTGHNEPGGGFAGGLVAGLALVLRYLAGGRLRAGRGRAGRRRACCSAPGCSFAGGTGVVGLAAGRARSCRRRSSRSTLPVLGDVHLVTSLFFDIGVYLVVVGLVLDMLRSLGAELDRQEDEDDPIDGRVPDEVIVR